MEVFMKNTKFFLGILVMVLVFGMTVVGCDNFLDNEENGTYVCSGYAETKLYNGSYECTVYSSGTVEEKGTYIIKGNIISFTQTYPQNYTYVGTYFPKEKKYVFDSGHTYIRR
jgi:hypothetical protein